MNEHEKTFETLSGCVVCSHRLNLLLGNSVQNMAFFYQLKADNFNESQFAQCLERCTDCNLLVQSRQLRNIKKEAGKSCCCSS